MNTEPSVDAFLPTIRFVQANEAVAPNAKNKPINAIFFILYHYY